MKNFIALFLFLFCVNNIYSEDFSRLRESIDILNKKTEEYLKINNFILKEILETGTLSSSSAKKAIRLMEKISPNKFPVKKNLYRKNNKETKDLSETGTLSSSTANTISLMEKISSNQFPVKKGLYRKNNKEIGVCSVCK